MRVVLASGFSMFICVTILMDNKQILIERNRAVTSQSKVHIKFPRWSLLGEFTPLFFPFEKKNKDCDFTINTL